MGLGGVGVHLAGLGIDVALGLHIHAAAGDGLPVFKVGGQRHVDDVDRALWRSLDADVAGAVCFEIIRVGLQLVGSDIHHHLARLLSGLHDGISHAVGGAAGEGAHAVRAGVGIGGVNQHVVKGHTQRLGANLGNHRL